MSATVPFERVLVANRGEIAVRIIRTLHRLGIGAVAVYSDADRDALHVRNADAAIRLGPAAAVQSYLDIARVMDAVRRSGADALHPGYGFLAENAELARACAAAGIAFVGPPADVIETMGDKIRAKQTVAANGVRVVPGISDASLSDAALADAAAAFGLPVLIKPSAGGGGKGMHLVEHADALLGAIATARREARNAFGDDTLLIERFVARPRHIEVQVLADAHGHVVHLGERECSLQRRHQKIIEEAPSPLLDDGQREAIAAQAVAAARACSYVNAGTVEFIVAGDAPDESYFMEMNTRLQVEHPVTEEVWGLDLVEWQLRVAVGEPLGFAQHDLVPHGHAIEARVYAEDPARGFLPSEGRILVLREASGLAGVRIDSALDAGADVATTYDPMLAKVIASGATRDEARRRLIDALHATTVLGVSTNVGFLADLLDDADVVAGRLDTGLVERHVAFAHPSVVPPAVVAAAALAHVRGTTGAGKSSGPWADRRGWRIGAPAGSTWRARVDAGTIVVIVRALDATHDEISIDGGAAFAVEPSWTDDGRLRLDGEHGPQRLDVALDGDSTWIGCEGAAWQFRQPAPVTDDGTSDAEHSGAVISPMPGTVVAVHVGVGDTVTAGRPVATVEAMKMEHAVVAPIDGEVAEVHVTVGSRVRLGLVLAIVRPPT